MTASKSEILVLGTLNILLLFKQVEGKENESRKLFLRKNLIYYLI